MPQKVIFTDHDQNEMELYLNQNTLMVGICHEDHKEGIGGGMISLNKEDLGDLIKRLQEFETIIKDN